MKNTITIGHQIVDGKITKKEVKLDCAKLKAGRLFINAGSGGGKTWTIRRIVEQMYGTQPLCILDAEGDFVTLAEKFPFIVIGKGHGIPADPATAVQLAHKFLEHRFSMIVDLFEYDDEEMQQFVKVFLTALDKADKKHWRPLTVVIDELDKFAPEKNEGEAESTRAVANAGKRFRKRQFSLILATQRIAAVHKTVVSQCRNKLIGYADLDIDVKRSSAILGFRKFEERESLVDLEPGEFYARGPAISKTVVKLKVGPVQTRHEQDARRARTSSKPKATAEIKEMLKKLADLPQEAKQERDEKIALQKKIKELQAKIRELETELKKKPELKMDKEAVQKIADQAAKKTKMEMLKRFRSELHDLSNRLTDMAAEVPIEEVSLPKEIPHWKSPILRESTKHEPKPKGNGLDTEPRIAACEKSILAFLSLREGKDFKKQQVAAITGYKVSGSFMNAVSKLKTLGLIEKNGDYLKINSDRLSEIKSILGHEYMNPSRYNVEQWLNGKLSKCAQQIYGKILEDRDASFEKDELAKMTGYNVSGSFMNAISELRTIGLIEKRGGEIRFNPEMNDI